MDYLTQGLQGQGFGLQPDGSEKGNGFFGPMPNAQGGISTEISVNTGGPDFPTMVPGQTPAAMAHLLSGGQLAAGNPMSDQIVRVAEQHAIARGLQGKQPFAAQGEQGVYGAPVNWDHVLDYGNSTKDDWITGGRK